MSTNDRRYRARIRLEKAVWEAFGAGIDRAEILATVEAALDEAEET